MSRPIENPNTMMSQGVDNLIEVERKIIEFADENPDLSCKEKFEQLLKLCVESEIGVRGFAYLEARLIGYCKSRGEK